MVTEYAISKCTRRCSVSNRPLAPGEWFYSVLVPKGEEVSRRDIAAAAWTAAPEEAIAWWLCQMPEAAAKRLRPAPNGVLLDTLSEMIDRPAQEALAYLLALLLVRRRVLIEDEKLDLGQGAAEPQDAQACWRLTSPADGREWLVPVVVPDAAAIPALQDQLKTLLFTEE